MTPSKQRAESLKYIPRPYTFVPTSDGLALFLSYGARRELIDIFDDPAELFLFLESDFTHALEEHEQKLAAEAARARAAPGLSFNLEDLDIDLKL